MGDASMSVEQEVVIGQQPRKPVVPPAHQQEESASLSKHIDLEAFYQNEVSRFRAEQAIPGKKAWDVLEKVAKDKGSSGGYRQQEPGAAQSPDPKSGFPPELVQKIDILQRVLNMEAGTAEIGQLQTIINNPDYLDFVAQLTENEIAIDGNRVPILDNIIALDKAGVLKPVVDLYRSGVSFYFLHNSAEVKKMFEGQTADFNPQKYQQMVIFDIQNILGNLGNLGMLEFLQDPQKKEFVGLLADLRRKPIEIYELDTLDKLFGKDFSQKKEAIYVLKLILGSKEKNASDSIDIELSSLGSISDSQGVMEALTNKDFPVFLQTLQEKTGYTIDFINKSRSLTGLVDIFTDPALRQGLLQESTVKIIKELYPDGDIEFLFTEDYIRLGNNPNALQTIHALIGLGGNFSLEDLESILNNPDILNKLTSPELKSVVKSLETYSYKFYSAHIQELILLLESPDKEHIFKVLDLLKENFQFSYEPGLLAYYIRLAQIPDLENKLQQAGTSMSKGLPIMRDITVFVDLNADVKLYQYAERIFDKISRNTHRQLVIDCVKTIASNDNAEGKTEIIISLINEIKNTTSPELERIQEDLVPLILMDSQPQKLLTRIKAVFEKNNLPDFAKKFKIFEILYTTPEASGETKFDREMRIKGRNLSPVLKNASRLRRLDTIYKDLLRINIESGDFSLKTYLAAMQEEQTLLDKAEEQGYDVLSETETSRLNHFMNKLDVLYKNSLLGRTNRNSQVQPVQPTSLRERMQGLRTDLKARKGQTITDRVFEMFVKPLGYGSVQEVLERMNNAKKEAHQRNASNPRIKEGQLEVHAGDLLKGIKSNVLTYILQSGSIARDYLGINADSDVTPFDTDTSMVLSEDLAGGFLSVTSNSAAREFGDMIIVVRNRGQLARTDQQESVDIRYDSQHYELFKSSTGYGDRHYGIRTGFPSTEIDAVILDESLLGEWQDAKLRREAIFFNIANNGFYVPAVNLEGKVIFTEGDYNAYRLNPQSIQASLINADFKPKEFIDVLKASPYLKTLYEMSAGVSEGYRTDEHTVMAMNQFEKYFAKNFDFTFMTKEDFRLMLAFHDIGKPAAVNFTGHTFSQHEYTREILMYALQSTGLPTNKINSVISLVDQDILGDYIKGNKDAQTSAKEINSLAETIGLSPSELLKTLRMFYICDAGSYTADAHGKESLGHLFQFHPEEHEVKFAPETEDKYQRLVQEALH